MFRSFFGHQTPPLQIVSLIDTLFCMYSNATFNLHLHGLETITIVSTWMSLFVLVGSLVCFLLTNNIFVKKLNCAVHNVIMCCSSVKDVRANCFCASLLRTQIHMPRHATQCHAMHRARALSTKMNNDRADGHC